MRYWKELYVSEELKGREEEIIEHLEKKEFQFRVYLIALPENERNQLEIYHSGMLNQTWYREKDVFVVGLAKGYLQALEACQGAYRSGVPGDRGCRCQAVYLEAAGKLE